VTASFIAAHIAFALVCVALLVLPFVPAWREWRRPTDKGPLPIESSYTNDIDHFARRLRADAAARLGRDAPTGYEDFNFVPEGPRTDPSLGPSSSQAPGTSMSSVMDWARAPRRMISRHDICDDAAIRCPQPLYVEGNLRAGAGSAFSALYATGAIVLGPESEIHDWAHADGPLRMGRNAAALRRISSGTSVELGDEAWFERMQAPTLIFGRPREDAPSAAAPAPAPARVQQVAASYADLPNAVMQTPHLYLVRGDCVLGARRIYTGSLVVTGRLIIGPATTVVGDIKARLDLSMGEGAHVQGAITCEQRAYLFDGVRILGPLVSENDVLIGTGAVIGLPQSPTTVSARNIIVQAGAVVHGTIWAHEIGMVKPL
jgi:predicted acyltransferase (DUF342 family)